jgi:hypothetical protein
MDTLRKNLFLYGAGALGIISIVLFVKHLLHHHDALKLEAAGKGIDEKLRESLAALDKATANVQQVFENIKHLKT